MVTGKASRSERLVHWTYIGQVERGERNLTLQSIQFLAKAFRMKMATLFRGIG